MLPVTFLFLLRLLSVAMLLSPKFVNSTLNPTIGSILPRYNDLITLWIDTCNSTSDWETS